MLVVTPVVGALPGPGGVFIFAGGMALLLKNSNWVKRVYARHTRRYPRQGRLADKVLRRPPAPRGRPKPELDEQPSGLWEKLRALLDFSSRAQ
ncbi:hypothetical protein [Sphingomonas sp. ID1715]|uniref:hypothetical protein n=1 Tax=Sphingomonas sp. ID1715 TaxID=1656898 RepID=UPI0015837145|nr:hypothetical protein [Sphingomonas sp. ID1715]